MGVLNKPDLLNKPKTIRMLFMAHKDEVDPPTKTTTENEEREEHGEKNLEYTNKPQEEDAEKVRCENLIESVSISLQKSPSKPIKLCSSIDLISDDSSTNMQRIDKHDRLELQSFADGTSKIQDMEVSKSCFDSVDLNKQKQRLKIFPPTRNEDQRKREGQDSSRTKSEGNKVLVRFLGNRVNQEQLNQIFKTCGEILNIECPDVQKPLLKTACIDFKTRNGLENAIRKSGKNVVGTMLVESASSDNRTTMIPVPSLLGDPDIPAALVKNPSRTIRIEQLTQEISSHHIVEALAFCKSKVSGYFLGSSHSVAYVELETEIGKERALAKHSINVLGRHMVLLRIDCPRTTVVRITSTFNIQTVLSICKSLGDVSSSRPRCNNVVDVHFNVAEWPNMLKILNRLNGLMVNDSRLQAESAPVFPPEVLLALWHHPQERKHLKDTAQAILHKLDGKLHTSELAVLQNQLFSTLNFDLHAESEKEMNVVA